MVSAVTPYRHTVGVSRGFSKLTRAVHTLFHQNWIFSCALEFVNPEGNETRRCPNIADNSDSTGC